jgi:hypothetical protein
MTVAFVNAMCASVSGAPCADARLEQAARHTATAVEETAATAAARAAALRIRRVIFTSEKYYSNITSAALALFVFRTSTNSGINASTSPAASM